MKRKTKLYKMMNTPVSLMFKTAMVSFLAEWYGILWDLRWMLFLGGLLIALDLWFGISESKYKKLKVSWSEGRNSTLIKVVDYFCYISLGIAIGKAIGMPYGVDPLVVAVTVMLICYLLDLNSIYKHICRLHDIEPKYDIWDFLRMILTLKFKKFGYELWDVIQEIKKNRKNK